jgi:TetR/AcrR family transcriptional repressor of bet genes
VQRPVAEKLTIPNANICLLNVQQTFAHLFLHARLPPLLPKDSVMPPKETTPAGTRPRKKADIKEFRRISLVEGAIRSLAERGVSGTTVSTICAEAGSSRGLISHYFDGKDDVLVAALHHLFGKLRHTIGETLKPAGDSAVLRLKALPAALFAPEAFTQVNRTAFLSLWHETRFNDQVRNANRTLYRDYVARMDRMFADAAAELGIRIDTRRAALGFIALSDGVWLDMSIHDDVLSTKQAISLCEDYIVRELQV